jgi:hypothetical protein
MAEDDGPGIRDVGLAMEDDYTTGSGLGSGISECEADDG